MRLGTVAATEVHEQLLSHNGTSISGTDMAPLIPFAAVPDSNEHRFRALQYALFSTTFVEVLGGVFFMVTAMYILRDKSRAEKAVAGESFDCDHLLQLSLALLHHLYHAFTILKTMFCVAFDYCLLNDLTLKPNPSCIFDV